MVRIGMFSAVETSELGQHSYCVPDCFMLLPLNDDAIVVKMHILCLYPASTLLPNFNVLA